MKDTNISFVDTILNAKRNYGLIQDGLRIGKWVEEDSFQIRTESFYGYDSYDDNTHIMKVNYVKNDNIGVIVKYQSEHIYDLNIIDSLLYQRLESSFILDEIGFQLYQTNCGGCHQYFPMAGQNKFEDKLNSLYQSKKLIDFIHEGSKADDSLYLYHPSFRHLGSLEISKIIKYVNSGNVDEVLPDRGSGQK